MSRLAKLFLSLEHSRFTSTILIMVALMFFGIAIGNLVTITNRADTYQEGQIILLPPHYKLVGIQVQGKKPMALVRPMRDDEKPEVWVYKPLDTLNYDEGQLAAEPATVIRESSDLIRK